MMPFLIGLTVVFLPIVLIFTCAGCMRLGGYRRLSAEQAAEQLVEHWRKSPTSGSLLPEFLQGVFWMGGNPAPELLACLMGQDFDPVTRRLTLRTGDEFNWSYNDNLIGWLHYLTVTLLGVGSSIVFQFNEDYSEAEFEIMVFGLLSTKKLDGSLFKMKRQAANGNSWDRLTFSGNGEPYALGTYVLRRVMDKDGNRLPAFADMLKEIDEGVLVQDIKGTEKTKVQLIQTRPTCFGFCRRRRARTASAEATKVGNSTPAEP